MNTERDKRIAKALEIEWYKVSDKARKYGDTRNPRFSTAEGMLLILQKGKEALGKRWEWFLISRGACPHPILEKICIPLWLLQDPDRLASELYTFLKEDVICGQK